MSKNSDSRKPILSIIVPVYNVENYVEECIISLINQTIQDIEIIVVNDGSRDNSINLIKKINDSRIKILDKVNGGLSSARNFGLKNANGKYIAFVDSDDFISIKTAYQEMVELGENNDLDIVVGNANRYYNNSKIVAMNKENQIFNEVIVGNGYYFKYCVDNRRVFAPVWQSIYRTEFILKNELFFK